MSDQQLESPVMADSPAEGETLSDAQHAEAYARYAHLRANVRKRRMWLTICIILAVVVFAATIVDMTAVESKLKWYLLPAYIVLFIIAVLLLLSRARAAAERAELKELERALLQCPSCRKVFRYGEIVFHHDDKLTFSCPHCGVFSRHPHAGARAHPVPRPTGEIIQRTYKDAEGEQFTFGIYKGKDTDAPTFYDVKIRGKGELERGPTEIVAEDGLGEPPAGA